MDVNPVKQRTGYPFLVFGNDNGNTPAGPLWVTEVATRVGIHRGNTMNFLATLGFHPFCIFGIFEPAGSNIFNIEETKMTRRAVIYIRTSSETQGENSSPVDRRWIACILPKKRD